MTGTSSSRLALGVVALLAFGLRVFPFFGPEGAWSYRVDYDEGVYFASAAWFVEGVMPWRDHVFVHPPGQLFFLTITSVWTKAFVGIAGAFAFSRWVAALLGVLNTVLVGVIVSRVPNAPRAAVLLSAAMYATYSEVVQVERGPFIEPLLNALCLTLMWLVMRDTRSRRVVIGAGIVAGLAVSVKVWAVLWIVGALTVLTRREWLPFMIALGVTAGVVVAPLALLAPTAFLHDVGLLHLWRPPDGTLERLARLEQIVSVRHLASPLLGLIAIVLLRQRARPMGVVWLLTLAAFFTTAAWWNQYNAHLIASEAVLAGLALTALPTRARAIAMALTVISIGMSIAHTVRRSASTDDHLALKRSPLSTTADCLFTFEPAWGLAANRLPPRETGPLVDSYATQLLTAVDEGRVKFVTATEAFASHPELPRALTTCRYLYIGDRAGKQLSLESLRSTHHPIESAPGFWELN